MAIILNQHNRKVVATCTSNKSLNAVQNMVRNQIEPKIDTAIQNEFGADITNLVIQHRDYTRSVTTTSNNNEFEIYPKTLVSGEFNGTLEQFELRVDNIVNAFKILIGDEINIFGGTLVLNGFHIHRTTGSSDEN